MRLTDTVEDMDSIGKTPGSTASARVHTYHSFPTLIPTWVQLTDTVEDMDSIGKTPGSAVSTLNSITLSPEAAAKRAAGDPAAPFAEKQWRQTWMIMEYCDRGSLQV